jgi:lipid-A-disaccharide synthase-like uncharacterized protein
MIDNIAELLHQLVFDKNTWYLIGTMGTFVVTAVGL